MSTTLDSAPPVPTRTAELPAAISVDSPEKNSSPGLVIAPALGKCEPLLTSLLTASACLHLLIVGWIGYGAPKHEICHRARHEESPSAPVIENVHLEEPPPPQQSQEITKSSDVVSSTSLNLPAPAAPISAVPANVAVNFAIKVVGPVHLVSTTAESSSSALTNTVALPTEVTGRNLLTPEIAYPPIAKYKHLTGDVVIEFHTTARGDISEVKVRVSSGHAELDQAALENLRLGRWVGEAGYFTKSYHFVLR